MIKKILSVTVLLCLTVAFKAYCGWPTRPGRLIISPSFSYFNSSQDWDSVGHVNAKPNNGIFTSTNVSLFSEYGISRRIAANVTLPFISYHLRNDSAQYSKAGLGDAELSLKFYVANIGYRYYFTVQTTGIVPLYGTGDLGYGQLGTELRLGLSGAGKIGSKFYSLSFENGVRQYYGSNAPSQDRYNASFGLTLDKKFHDQLTLGISGIYSKSSLKAFTSNIYTARDYSFTQASISYGHTFNSHLSLFFTASRFIIGRNTSVGNNGSVSLIYHIDNVFARKVDY
ncbi:hypothetical protein HH214_03665 [Mucilaginibacter robiniae]|uniref:Uncharacterized protein n=1 Tax=Mucilaginibacter robiniae TaxID=2728022 RepID=A0A7L5DVB8_9SPHI|nr:hypothetical protein [Mucilaginibacter robiniae]QJD95040.1 hypothetical protein HH214_03665 [Mucilaginibacter robiniae]